MKGINVTWRYDGSTGGYHIEMGGEEVHFTKDTYQRDMFIAELKARIKLILMNDETNERPTPDANWKSAVGCLPPYTEQPKNEP